MIRGNFRDELTEPPNVLGSRLVAHSLDHFMVSPVMNADDVVHMLDTLQVFCAEENGAGGHGAETVFCHQGIDIHNAEGNHLETHSAEITAKYFDYEKKKKKRRKDKFARLEESEWTALSSTKVATLCSDDFIEGTVGKCHRQGLLTAVK